MGKIILYALLLIGFTAIPVHAQPKFIKKVPTKKAALTHAVRRKTIRPLTSLARIRRSVIKITDLQPIHPLLPPLQGSAFAIETTHKGKKKLWGISATHYFFQNPALAVPGKPVPITFVAQGATGMNDVALFEIPEKYAHYWSPLKLAQTPVELGQVLHSLGFFEDAWHHETNRIVEEITPHRILTSLKTSPWVERDGACGGPVLNAQNEVVGVHVGSSRNRNLGFVLPAQHIRDIITAYYQNGQFTKPLIFRGVTLGSIAINEHIERVIVKERGLLIRKLELFHNEKDVDYNHLENLLSTQGGDEITFVILQRPFSPNAPDLLEHIFSITYDLENGEITRLKDEELDSFFIDFN